MDHPSGQIDKIEITGYALRAQATEGTAETTVTNPTTSQVNYDTVVLVACFDLTTEAEEDNIERKGFRSHLIKMFSAKIANDLAHLIIEGDNSLGNATAEQQLLRSFDGVHIQTQTTPNLLDVNGLGVSLKMFKDLRDSLDLKQLQQ